MFQQEAAPTGWTKDLTHHNKAMRIVNGAVGSGGTVLFTTAFASKSVSGSISTETAGGSISTETAGGSISNQTAGGTVGGYTLAASQMPSHSHVIASGGAAGAGQALGGNYLDYSYFAPQSAYSYILYGTTVAPDRGIVGYQGSSGSHDHTFTGTAHSHTFTGTGHAHTFTGTGHAHTFSGTSIDLAVQYVDFIIAQKN